MQKLFIPASFLSDVFSAEKNVLPTDNGLYILREEIVSNSSKLYQLFFGGQPPVLKKAIVAEEIISDPDYYCNYE
ncbi:hypothetical protein ESA94_14335 [Lacibacter luteus]|uniref:Uncharacterized protein n=1 Tax=Lacibacter luteus TaxID=2508719 RepID=A0A4V1M7D0_9BACT|nr:hypothetical protein [Lacibacter luteus]RXK59314.1 hypothetical protein ESA94_14335 [Lacibacter luteus]